MSGWIGAAATRCGTRHTRQGHPRQDALTLRFPEGRVVAVVADGAGSARRGGAGAAVVCRAVGRAADAMIGTVPPRETDLADVLLQARESLADAADRAGCPLRDLATTALLAASDGETTCAAHVGDGAAVVRGEAGWRTLSWPESGEHVGTTRFLTETPPAIRTARLTEPVTALALFTDGLERLVLDLASGTPHGPFFHMIAAPLDRSAADRATPAGRHADLSAALGRYLDSDPVNARTDDDKTLVIAVSRPGAETFA